MTSEGRRRRRRHRRGRKRRVRESGPKQMKPITYDLPVYEFLSEDEVKRLHQASMRILSEFGIDFYDDEMLAILSDHGADVQGNTVYFAPDIVEEYVAKAPRQFTQLARNSDNNVVIGGNQIVFAPVYGVPYVLDLDGGRRDATLDDFQNFVKLAYLSPYIHHSGGTVVEPTDQPTETRHLDMVFSHIKYGDKAFMGSVTAAEHAADSVAMAEIVFGKEVIRENPALVSLINVSSPRRYDARMLGALKVYARARQGLIITPFILAGAMGPVSLAGTITQLNAEVLAGVALTQMIEPGTPVVYGSFLTNIDLQSGSPVFGTPESQIGLYASAQLARYYGLPFRGGGAFSSSKIPDAQAGYESLMVMLPAVMARTNFVLHSAGWLENVLVAGYEKFVLDCEVLGMLHRWAEGLDVSKEELEIGLEAVQDVEPGGHHLGTELTLSRFRDAFYRAELFDYQSFQDWEDAGAEDAYTRANKKVKQLLADYEPPELDSALEEELIDFMEHRKAELLES